MPPSSAPTTVFLALPMRPGFTLHAIAATGAFMHPVRPPDGAAINAAAVAFARENPDAPPGSAMRAGLEANPFTRVVHGFGACSLLPLNFNSLWCQALNARKDGITHFAMLHDDVCPEPHWLDKLLAELTRLDADIVSCVIPFKDDCGLTSTAVETGDPWNPRRLTMHEVHRLPPTFGDADVGGEILLNTGCFVADLRKPWVEHVAFRQADDTIRRGDGTFAPRTASEDWNFTRDVRAVLNTEFGIDARLFATRAVKLQHEQPRWDNSFPWGRFQTDPNHAPKPVARPGEAA